MGPVRDVSEGGHFEERLTWCVMNDADFICRGEKRQRNN
uniref:Uncharacterized protein n=1 Tax=Anguilla anguilla TaxID=7936 RepID=A0A0E9P573_ANGAN